MKNSYKEQVLSAIVLQGAIISFGGDFKVESLSNAGVNANGDYEGDKDFVITNYIGEVKGRYKKVTTAFNRLKTL